MNATEFEEALRTAAEAHAGQKRRDGITPAIIHPLRVAMTMSTDRERAAAVLHDVLEDSEWKADDLFMSGISVEVFDAVDALTRRKGETYADYIARCALNPLARKVKIADIRDNMSDCEGMSDDEIKSLWRRWRRALAALGWPSA